MDKKNAHFFCKTYMRQNLMYIHTKKDAHSFCKTNVSET